jgi:hypothetical protein
MENFCRTFNQFSTKENEIRSLRREIEHFVFEVVAKAVSSWNNLGGDWKIKDFAINIDGKHGIIVTLPSFTNAVYHAHEVPSGAVADNDAFVIRTHLIGEIDKEIPGFGALSIIIPS